MSEMDCSAALSRMHQFLDKELTEANADEIREHLAECEPCLDDFDSEQALKELVHRCCSNKQAPPQLRGRIMDALATASRQVDGIEQAR